MRAATRRAVMMASKEYVRYVCEAGDPLEDSRRQITRLG